MTDTLIELVPVADIVVEVSPAPDIVVEVIGGGPPGIQGPPSTPDPRTVLYNDFGGVPVTDDDDLGTATSRGYVLDVGATILTVVGQQLSLQWEQEDLSDTWEISHPLPYLPNVSLMDGTGTTFLADRIVHTPGVVTAHLLVPAIGTATLT